MTREARIALAFVGICWLMLFAYALGKMAAIDVAFASNGEGARVIEGTHKVLEERAEMPVSP